MKIGVRVPACDRIDAFAEAVALAERLGFDSAWVPDSQLIWRDTWMALALAATRTTAITLGTAVTNVVTRHPSVIASATRTLQEIAGDRVVLGLGAAWSAAGMVGAPAAGSQRLSSSLEAIRTLLRGGHTDFDGTKAELRDPAGPCPVYLAATGPRNLRAAGAIADGVIITQATTPERVRSRVDEVRFGAHAVRREWRQLDVVAWAPIHVTDDLEGDVDLFKPNAFIGLRNQAPQDRGGPSTTNLKLDRVPDGIEPDGTHVSDWDRAVASCSSLIPDEIALEWARSFALVGDRQAIRGQLEALAEEGTTTILLTPLAMDSNQTLPVRLLESLASALDLGRR